VDQNYPEGQPRKIIVQGRPDACKKASVMIRELINGEPGSAQAIIQRVCQEVRRGGGASAPCSWLPPLR
jgi:far upstream element-binding protein